jgi:hypothetical protein
MFAKAKPETGDVVKKCLDKNFQRAFKPFTLFKGYKVLGKLAVVVMSNPEGKCGSDEYE